MERLVANARKTLVKVFSPHVSDNLYIPDHVLQDAKGIIIVSTIKAGFGITTKAGSGILVAKGRNGDWSSPLAIKVRGIGLGAELGIKKTEYVIILNSVSAVLSLATKQIMVGSDLNAVAGPIIQKSYMSTRVTDTQLHWHLTAFPNYAYASTRGIYGGIGVHGDIFSADTKLNKDFYGRRIRPEMIVTQDTTAKYRENYNLRRDPSLSNVLHKLTQYRTSVSVATASAVSSCSSCGESATPYGEQSCFLCKNMVVYSQKQAVQSSKPCMESVSKPHLLFQKEHRRHTFQPTTSFYSQDCSNLTTYSSGGASAPRISNTSRNDQGMVVTAVTRPNTWNGTHSFEI